MKFVICMVLFLNSCATLKIKLNPINQSNAESDDGSDEQVEKIWIEYFDILNNGELKDVLSFMKPSVIFTFNNQTIKTEDHDQLFLLLKQWKENQKKKDIYIKNHSISSGKVADDFITIVDVKQDISQTGKDGLQNIKPCTTETEKNQSSTTNLVEIKEG